jgi:hypothetical protein
MRAGRRVDEQRGGAVLALRRSEGRAFGLLRAFHIGDRGTDRREFGAREAPEPVERRYTEEAARPISAGRGVEKARRKRRHDAAEHVEDRAEFRIVEHRFGDDEFPRVDAHDLGEQPVAYRHRNQEDTGGDVDPGECQFLLAAHAAERHQVIGFGRREQLFLGDGPRRDEADDVALHHGFRAALLRLRRIFDLFAHGDAMAEPDQLLQIVVGGVDRHAAHRDVLAEMLAAFGERDAEGAAGDFRVFEEQLVEVAHAVEQQRIRVRCLDLDELLHHRRRRRRRSGIGSDRTFLVQGLAVSARRETQGKPAPSPCLALYAAPV